MSVIHQSIQYRKSYIFVFGSVPKSHNSSDIDMIYLSTVSDFEISMKSLPFIAIYINVKKSASYVHPLNSRGQPVSRSLGSDISHLWSMWAHAMLHW